MQVHRIHQGRIVIYLWAVISTAGYTFCLGNMEGDPPQLIYSFLDLCLVPIFIPTGLAITFFFMDFPSKKIFCTDFFSKSMCTAYLIQLIFSVPVAVKCWELIINGTGISVINSGQVIVGYLSSYMLYIVAVSKSSSL